MILNTRKKYKKYNTLGTTAILALVSLLLTPNIVFSNSDNIILIDAKMSSPVYGLLNLNIKKPKEQELKFSVNNCDLDIFTNIESFWTVDTIEHVTKRYVNTDFFLKENGAGAILKTPCGTDFQINETLSEYKVNIDTKLEAITPIAKSPFAPIQSIRPQKRPDVSFEVKREDIKTEVLEKKDFDKKTNLSKENQENEDHNLSTNLEAEVITKIDEVMNKLSDEKREVEKTIDKEINLKEEKNIKENITSTPTANPHYDLVSPQFRRPLEENITLIPDPFTIDIIDGDFLESRRNIADAIYNSPNALEPKVKLLELLIQKGLFKEALSAIYEIDIDNLKEQEKLNILALRDIMSIIDSSSYENLDLSIVNNPEYQTWDDYNLWTNILRFKSYKEVDDSLFKDLKNTIENYPEVIKDFAFPILMESAINNGKWNAARDLSLIYQKMVEKDDPTFNFLLGEAALRNNKTPEAFDAFAVASLGDGLFAQRAKLKIVDIGLSTSTMPLEDAKVFLEDLVSEWRGDDWEVQSLIRLVSVYESLNKTTSALITMGDIIRRFPSQVEELKYTDKARNLIEKIYQKGIDGEIPLDTFFNQHKLIKRSFNFFPDYHTYTEIFADKLLSSGATLAAANEYKEIYNLLTLMEENNMNDITSEDVGRLLLKHAEAHLDGDRLSEAQTILDDFNTDTATPDQMSKYRLLLANVEKDIGNVTEVKKLLRENKDFESSLIEGNTYYEEESWIDAYNSYSYIKETFPEKFNKTIALNTLVSAYKNKDSASVYEIVSEYPELLETEEWVQISAGLNDMDTKVDVMNEKTTQRKVDSGDDTQNLIEETLQKEDLLE